MNHDSGVSLVDLLDEFTEFFQEEKASELEKAKETKIQNTSPGDFITSNRKIE